MRELLYVFKKWLEAVFKYPVQIIDPSVSQDYDAYWSVKRGKRLGDLSSWQKERADFILRVLGNGTESVTIGDIGCGDGSILHYMQQALPGRVNCHGYDNSERALSYAREYGIETTKLDVSIRGEDTHILPADYYLLLETLEHIPHSEYVLTELFKKVKKGIFFSFPNTGYITYRLRLLFGRFPLQWHVMPNEHLRYWTYRDLIWWLGALGFASYRIHVYKGIPLLGRIFPSLFGAAFIVYLPKHTADIRQDTH
jgi:2-polyprenyl-3-methyl-5-hydroxy-6-metoxy-1,4-benzoquinol methylase